MFKNKNLGTTNMPDWFYQNQDPKFLFGKQKQNLNGQVYSEDGSKKKFIPL